VGSIARRNRADNRLNFGLNFGLNIGRNRAIYPASARIHATEQFPTASAEVLEFKGAIAARRPGFRIS